MDFRGIWLPVVVAVVAAAILFMHVQQVRRRPATSHDRLMGALWAAMVVLALGRIVIIVAGGDEPKDAPREPAPAVPLGK